MKQMAVKNVLDKKKLQERFNIEMNNCIENWTDYKDIKEIDLFMFPFHVSDHYFVFSINFKLKRYDILNNSSSQCTSTTPLARYVHCPETLVSNIVNLLSFFI